MKVSKDLAHKDVEDVTSRRVSAGLPYFTQQKYFNDPKCYACKGNFNKKNPVFYQILLNK